MTASGRRPRVLWVSSPVTSSRAGGERVVQRIVEGLDGWDHEFLGGSRALFDLFREGGREARLASAAWEPVNPLHVLLFPASIVRGLAHFRRFRDRFARADVIICPTSFTEVLTVFPWVVRALGKRPIALWQNRLPRSIRWSPLLPLLRSVHRRCRAVFVSAAQARAWQELGAVDAPTVILNGVSVGEPPDRRRDGGPVTVGFLGRMHEQKGVDTLLAALAGLDPPGRVRVLLAGDGPHLARFRALGAAVTDPRIELRWIGWVDAPGSFYDELDLLVLPSRTEAFSLVALEAWERGVPVLTSDIGAFRELKEYAPPAERELVFRVGDPGHLAERLRRFLERGDSLRTAESARSLHSVVERHFDERRVLSDYEALFRGVLAEA